MWGQAWLAARIIPRAHNERRPYFHFDNGYVLPARGGSVGTYRICYRGMSPVLLADAPAERAAALPMRLMPWRPSGTHVLLALPGADFGCAIGLDMAAWAATAEERIRSHTDRPIVVRPRHAARPLAQDLPDAWALVTHSSNAAVDAVLAGIPVFVEPTSAAAPVGNLDLADLERPAMPEREPWLRSLACQQFTLAEMQSGEAYAWMQRVVAQVDGAR